ncbi:hypothetical protein JZU61_04510 [bacterium]|jgi:hypothetical protein|nr:hypothetical protein [bacterium]
MTVKERIIEYIKFKGISIRSFCRTVGVAETYVNSMRNSIQPDKLAKITLHFPDLNPGWLLTGEGEMIRPSPELPTISRDQLIEVGSDVFKDKVIDMFKKGEIFSATIFWEQHRMIIELKNQVDAKQKEITSLKILLAKNGIEVQE